MLDGNDRRLIVFDHDVDAIVCTHARDRKVAGWLQDTADADERDPTPTTSASPSKRATRLDPQHQATLRATLKGLLLRNEAQRLRRATAS